MPDDVVQIAAHEAVESGDLVEGARTTELARRGWLYRSGAFLLALRRLEPPETSVDTVRIIACDQRLVTPERWPHLVTRLLQQFRAERLHLRSRAPAGELEPLGLQVFLHFVAKEARPEEAEGVELRPAVWPDDHDYVADLMCASLQSGMPHARFTDEQLQTYVHGYLRLGRPGGCEALIAWVDGQRVGTAVFRRDVDDVSGERITRLVDIMTDKHGRGHGWRIAPALEMHVACDPTLADTIVGTVVGEEDGSEKQVIERLERAGWRLDHTLWTARD
jgi:hypothetical protein